MTTIYDFELDDQCYKVRLTASLLAIPCQYVAVDMLPGQQQARPPLSRLNPLHTLPIMVDGEVVLREAEPIMVYLACAHDPSRRFFPDAPAALGRIAMWLHFAARDLAPVAAARLAIIFGASEGLEDGKRRALAAFRIMEDHMTRRGFEGGAWFVGEDPTLADVALFPSLALSRDLGIDHEAYPALRRWMRRVRGLNGFIVMPGIPQYG